MPSPRVTGIKKDQVRPDSSLKSTGFLGILKLSSGYDATEYSISGDDVQVNGKNIDFPTLVPTLTQKEVDLMVNDIIPNRKKIPQGIIDKAIVHAKKRLSEEKSVFWEKGDKTIVQRKVENGKVVAVKYEDGTVEEFE
jgi:hypothetical protein